MLIFRFLGFHVIILHNVYTLDKNLISSNIYDVGTGKSGEVRGWIHDFVVPTQC